MAAYQLHNSSRMMRANRLNKLENARLMTTLGQLNKATDHAYRINNQDIRMLRHTLDYITQSSGHSKEGLHPDHKEPKAVARDEPYYMYGERVQSRKNKRRAKSAVVFSSFQPKAGDSETQAAPKVDLVGEAKQKMEKLLEMRPKSSPAQCRYSNSTFQSSHDVIPEADSEKDIDSKANDTSSQAPKKAVSRRNSCRSSATVASVFKAAKASVDQWNKSPVPDQLTRRERNLTTILWDFGQTVDDDSSPSCMFMRSKRASTIDASSTKASRAASAKTRPKSSAFITEHNPYEWKCNHSRPKSASTEETITWKKKKAKKLMKQYDSVALNDLEASRRSLIQRRHSANTESKRILAVKEVYQYKKKVNDDRQTLLQDRVNSYFNKYPLKKTWCSAPKKTELVEPRSNSFQAIVVVDDDDDSDSTPRSNLEN